MNKGAAVSGKVQSYIRKKLENEKLHFTLIDPEKLDEKKTGMIAKEASQAGTDAIMLGGSTGITSENLDKAVIVIKENARLPVILFPGDVSGVSKYADAIFFMSLLNSRNPYYITGAQAAGAIAVKKLGIEPISMGYIVVEPGGMVGYIGDAKLIPRSKPEIAVGYALAAQYLGMNLIYLEGGSGIPEPIPKEMISMVRKTIDIPLVVGGGIRTEKDASAAAQSGADIIVTGTVVEDAGEPGKVSKKLGEIVKAVKAKK